MIEYLNWWSQSGDHIILGLLIHGAVLGVIVHIIDNMCRVGIAFTKRKK